MKAFIRPQISFQNKEWKTLQRLGEVLAFYFK
jgi:hypothetical protein